MGRGAGGDAAGNYRTTGQEVGAEGSSTMESACWLWWLLLTGASRQLDASAMLLITRLPWLLHRVPLLAARCEGGAMDCRRGAGAVRGLGLGVWGRLAGAGVLCRSPDAREALRPHAH